MTKTYTRARTAKAKVQAILDNHELAGRIETSEVEPNRFTAAIYFDHGIDELAIADLEGFEIHTPEGNEAAEEIVEEMDKAAAVEQEKKRSRTKYINEVSTHMGVVAEVHEICDQNPDMARKDVIELCRSRGIAYGTARTQYQKWFGNQKMKTL